MTDVPPGVKFVAFGFADDRALRWPLAACALAVFATAGGCRNHAYNQVYTEKLTSEIRVLEDQLYACDYDNRVLQQKVERLRDELAALEGRDASDAAPRRRERPRAADIDDVDDLEDALDAEPDVELGDPAPPDIDFGDPDQSQPFAPPEIEEGDLMRPGAAGESDDADDQIRLPGAVNILFDREPGPPHAVEIDPVRSRGHDFDSQPGDDGVHLLLSVVDEAGAIRPPDRGIEVAILDPSLDGAEARLGKWAFTAKDLQRLARGNAEGRIPLPIHWQEATPSGDSVVVFVRMNLPDGGQFTTDRVIPLRRKGSELWTPRGR